MGVDINMGVGRASQVRKLIKEEKDMDPENVQTLVGLYFDSLKDSKNRHTLTQKYSNLAEASTSDIEADAGVWFSGFAAGVRLLDHKSKVPPLEMVLGGITKSFETEIAA